MAFSIDLLRDEDGRAALDLVLAASVGSGRNEEGEALLAPLLAALRTYLSDLCLTLPPAAVAIAGWDAFNARVELLASEAPLSAIGIDISADGDASDGAGRNEQRLTCVYFDARCGYDFAAAGADDIVASLSDGRAAGWAGGLVDSDQTLSTLGLAPLLEALRRRPVRDWTQLGDEEDVRDNISSWLAERLRHLRVHQALQHALADNGLAAALPIVVATDALTPCLAAVYVAERVVGSRDREAARRETERAEQQAEHDRATEEQIARWRDERAAIRGWSGDAEQRRAFVEYVELTEDLARAGTPLWGLEPGHSLDDAAFEQMVDAYRHHRNPEQPPGLARSPAPSDDPPPSSALRPAPPAPSIRVAGPLIAARGTPAFGRKRG